MADGTIRGSAPKLIPTPTLNQTVATTGTHPLEQTTPAPVNPHADSKFSQGGADPKTAPKGSTGSADARNAVKTQTARVLTSPLTADLLGKVGNVVTDIGTLQTARRTADSGLDLMSSANKIAHSKVLEGSESVVAKGLKAVGVGKGSAVLAKASDKLSGLGKVVTVANVVSNTVAVKNQTVPTIHSVVNAFAHPTGKNVNEAVQNVAKESKSLTYMTKGSVSTLKMVSGTIANATKGSGAEIVEKAAIKAAAHGVAEGVATGSGKVLARMIPGASVVIAGADIAIAAHDWADPHTTRTKAVFSSITAFGSSLAAVGTTAAAGTCFTGIGPVLGETLAAVGTGIAVASSLLGAWFTRKDGGKK